MAGASVRRHSSTPEASTSGIRARSEQEWRDCYPLHACAFDNNYGRMQQLLEQGAKSDHQDLHGNTPLHIAAMLGHKDSIEALLFVDAPVHIKNAAGWTALHEAVSYGDREIITMLLVALKEQVRDSFKARKPHLLQVLRDLDDFYLELKWDFHSWVPLVSRLLPSDVCKIYKRKAAIRFDTSLVDMKESTWQRGDISFIYNSDAPQTDRLVMLDNNARVFQRIKIEEKDTELDEEINMLMSTDMVNVGMSTKTINFHRSQLGWMWKQDRSERVGDYESDVYTVDGMYLASKKRREHLSEEDVKKNKAIVTGMQRGTITSEDLQREEEVEIEELNGNFDERRVSLPPPQRHCHSFADYCENNTPLGRTPHVKTSCKHFKAHVYMSTEFPLSTDQLLDILEMVAPKFKHIEKLRKFCLVRMPPGFPVKLELPIFPTVTAKVTFQKMQFRNDLTSSMFTTPKGYKEDKHHFKDTI